MWLSWCVCIFLCCLKACTTQGLLETFQDMDGKLERIQKSLENYLESKRQQVCLHVCAHLDKVYVWCVRAQSLSSRLSLTHNHRVNYFLRLCAYADIL